MALPFSFFLCLFHADGHGRDSGIGTAMTEGAGARRENGTFSYFARPCALSLYLYPFHSCTIQIFRLCSRNSKTVPCVLWQRDYGTQWMGQQHAQRDMAFAGIPGALFSFRSFSFVVANAVVCRSSIWFLVVFVLFFFYITLLTYPPTPTGTQLFVFYIPPCSGAFPRF